MPNLVKDNGPVLLAALQANLGEAISYVPYGGSAVSLTAVVSQPRPLEPLAGGGRTVSVFKVPKADFDDFGVTPGKNDSVSFDGGTFTVIDVQTSPIDLVCVFAQRK